VKTLIKYLIVMALAAKLCMPGVALADYVQTWLENGLYGNPATPQTWNTAEAFLLSDGSWTGTGLTFSDAGWTATLVNPKYALATGPLHSGNFYFTTHSTDLTGPFAFDWVLSNTGATVGVYNVAGTPTGGWAGIEYTDPVTYPPENRSHAPLPPSALLLATGLLGLLGLRRKCKRGH
jgi:hypothetical protein